MRIFNWVHRKFRRNQHDYDYGVNDPNSDANSHGPPSESCLDERAKRVRISQEVKGEDSNRRDKNYSNVNEDTQALLGPRKSKVTELFSKWQNGLLTIGTFGIDQNDEGYDYGYESLDVEDIFLKETDDDEELINSIEVEVFEGKLEEVFGLKNENYYQVKDLKSQKWQSKGSNTELKGFVKEYSSSDIHKESSGHGNNTNNKNNGNNIYPLQEFFEVPLLAGTMTKEHRTTLADLFSRSKNYTSSNMSDDAPKIKFETESVEEEKIDLKLGKSGRSFIKNLLKWKKGGNLHRPKQWMKKMLNKKIYPESAAELHSSEAIGYLDVSKTYINASKIKEMNTENSSMDGKSSLSNGSASELASLLRDASKGSQECWIKTDSEYVVLEL